MSIELSSIIKQIKTEYKEIEHKTSITSAGRIISCNDGVITIEGLANCQNNELLALDNGTYAIAMNLEKDTVGAFLLAENTDISAGDSVHTTGNIVSVPVGKKLLGRVIDPLGNAIDGGAPLKIKKFRHIEAPAPVIINRGRVNRTLFTGIKAIDAMVPIGKGQRELIIGDRQTGKTALAIDAIINQKDKNVICVYVAIGQKSSTIARLVEELKSFNAMSYTVVVSSTAAQSAPLQYIAPYTGTAIAEEFMYNGKDVLIIYDDLSKHAVAYRTLSLLLKRPSGREAYPGDVFYVHSRLLERSGQLSYKLGGGSITALPIVETLGGDISSFIPTNIISITDGQIYLESDLFNADIRPAINVGLSVSRVGGAVQCPAMRKVSKSLRLELAHYREMQTFARFGAELDSSTVEILNHGKILTKILTQPQFKPMEMCDMVIELLIASKGDMSLCKGHVINNLISAYVKYIHKEKHTFIEEFRETGKLTDKNEMILLKNFEKFKEKYLCEQKA